MSTERPDIQVEWCCKEIDKIINRIDIDTQNLLREDPEKLQKLGEILYSVYEKLSSADVPYRYWRG